MKIIKVTPAQVHAAQIRVKRMREAGEEVPEALLKLSQARRKKDK